MVVFFIGDELMMFGELLKFGVIYNLNCFMLCGLLEWLGCYVIDYGIVFDLLVVICDMLWEVVCDYDVILMSGGVLVGDEDYVKLVVEVEGWFVLW